ASLSTAPTIASAIDREISLVEKEIVEAAEAMPEDKFDFSPEKLNLPGSDYKGVRTFGEQLKHIAASNYLICSPITGRPTTRLFRATFAAAHCFDHYGQMIEYLRMNGIVPPASRGH